MVLVEQKSINEITHTNYLLDARTGKIQFIIAVEQPTQPRTDKVRPHHDDDDADGERGSRREPEPI